jgi:hypothetical protein
MFRSVIVCSKAADIMYAKRTYMAQSESQLFGVKAEVGTNPIHSGPCTRSDYSTCREHNVQRAVLGFSSRLRRPNVLNILKKLCIFTCRVLHITFFHAFVL